MTERNQKESMERNRLMSTRFKANNTVIKSPPVKESSSGKYCRKTEAIGDCNSMQNNAVEEDDTNGFSWPPRSYTCSFCKREFRSAQALGGHMNVHRRDRARLRQSPPTSSDTQAPMLNLNLNFDPNFPNSSLSLLSSSSSSTTRLKPFNCTLPSSASPSTLHSSSPPPSPASPSHKLKRWALDGILLNPLSKKAPESSTKLKNARSLSGYGEYDHVLARQGGRKILKKAEIIRLDLEIGLLSDSKDDLDLELRLGTHS